MPVMRSEIDRQWERYRRVARIGIGLYWTGLVCFCAWIFRPGHYGIPWAIAGIIPGMLVTEWARYLSYAIECPACRAPLRLEARQFGLWGRGGRLRYCPDCGADFTSDPPEPRTAEGTRGVRRRLREEVAAAVAEAFPGCAAAFYQNVERSRTGSLQPMLGFCVVDDRGTPYSDVIWIDPTYEGEVTVGWVADAVEQPVRA